MRILCWLAVPFTWWGKSTPISSRRRAVQGCFLKPFRSPLLCALWLALIGGSAAFAQDFGSFAGMRSSHTGKVDLSGNEFIYDAKNDTFIARGSARMSQGPTLLQAHEMQFNRKTHTLGAQGDVRLADPEVDVTASRAEVNVDD